MQRSLGDEVLIAIIAVAVIAFATAFGVILSLVTTEPLEPTALPTEMAVLATLPPTATINFTPFATFTREASTTPDVTATETPSLTATVTETLTLTATPSLTDVPMTATASPSSTPTATPSPSATESPTVAASDTPTLEPSATSTDTVTLTPSATFTATLTATATATVSPSPQPTDTATYTATVSPTATLTATLTSTSTPTRTPTFTPTATWTRTPTRTASPAPTRTPIPTITLIPSVTPTATATSFPAVADCELRPNWARLTARVGDTVESLAAAAGIPMQRLLRRNCLADDALILPGDAVLLPESAAVVGAPSDAVMGCNVPTVASFDGLVAGGALRGLIEIRGTVGGDDFRRYRLEIRPDGYLRYIPILTGNTPVNGRVLGVLDTAALPSGLAWLRLVITTDAGVVGSDDACVVPVILTSNGE